MHTKTSSFIPKVRSCIPKLASAFYKQGSAYRIEPKRCRLELAEVIGLNSAPMPNKKSFENEWKYPAPRVAANPLKLSNEPASGITPLTPVSDKPLLE